MKKRNDVNGLRGISFLFIYFYHAYPQIFKCGFITVDNFILLSGFFSLYANKPQTIFVYITRKIKRIIPVGYSVLYMCYIFSNNFGKKSNLEIIYRDILSSFLGKSNIHFYNKAINYFGDSLDMSINLHYWYFSLQEQYYILFSLFILNKDTIIQNYIVRILFFYSLVYSIVYYEKDTNCMYYLISSRLWEFMYGIIILSKNQYIDNNTISYICYFIYFSLVMFIDPKNFYFPFPMNALFILLISITLISNSNKLFELYPLQILGNISFSLYLFHYPLLYIFKNEKENKGLLVFIFTFFISCISYQIIEKNHIINYLNPLSVFIIFLIIEFLSVYLLKLRIKAVSISYNFLTRTKALLDWHKTYQLFHPFIYNKYDMVILFMGDSHILQWIPAILKNDNIIYYNLIYFHYWINYIVYEKRNDILLQLSSLKIYYVILSNFLANCRSCILKRKEHLYRPFKSFIDRIVAYVKNIIYIIDDNPYHYKDVFINPNDGINYTYSILGVNASLVSFPFIENKKIKYINTTKWICYNYKCSLFKDNYSVYIGMHHLTISFTLSLYKQLNNEIILLKYKYVRNNSQMIQENFKCNKCPN